uniref:Exostosin GT47 domain-containing protein n=1 Tax=Kalanchoe fedtschenkoi TaxID=63787 RepID=A0A7N0TSP1_KALFE
MAADHRRIFKYTKNKGSISLNSPPLSLRSSALFLFILSLTICFLCFRFQPREGGGGPQHDDDASSSTSSLPSPVQCPDGILPFYVYDLPSEFNSGLLTDCHHLNVYTDMCPHVANFGMGQPVRSNRSWYATHQFLAEMIFHARAENHPCRTRDPAAARLFYVPFYGGLYASSKFRESNITARDQLALSLATFLQSQPHWRRSYGRDHFLALGRTAWDFMRPDRSEEDYGFNRLLRLPAVLNMSVLTVERNPWNGANQFGIPYTSYFHPSTMAELLAWQDHVRSLRRPHLFSFIGGSRKNLEKAAIRDNLITQCAQSTRCRLVKCSTGAAICHNPLEVLKVMMKSQFCLQAAGDSFTRRSTFDSVLAGCIPVFFSAHTAYTQYEWYLPSDRGSYSVFIDEDEVKMKGRSVEEELMKIPPEKVEKMRMKVIQLILKLTYVNPNSTDDWKEDAVSVALGALSRRYSQTPSSQSQPPIPTQ